MNERIEKQLSLEPKGYVKVICSVIVLAIFLVPSIMNINVPKFNAQSINVINKIISGFLHPEFSFLTRGGETGLMHLMIETLAIGFLGTLIGAVLALPLAFIASTNVTNKTISFICRTIIISIRTFPLFVYAIVFISIIGPGATCGVLTIGITSIGMLSKMFIEAIEGIDPQLLEAADALGLTLWQKCRYIIFGQLKSNFVSTTIYRFDINIKNSTALGLVGAGGIGTAINNSIGNNNWPRFAMIIYVLIIVVLIIDYLSTKIRKRLV